MTQQFFETFYWGSSGFPCGGEQTYEGNVVGQKYIEFVVHSVCEAAF